MCVLRVAVSLAVVFCLCAGGAAWADQSILVSKKVNNIATTMRMAEDPLSGNILIVMTELKSNDGSYGRVYAVLLKLLSSGEFKVRKVQLLSPASDWHGRGYPVYVHQKKMFLVCWDTGDPTAQSESAKIMARWVNRKTGKAVGEAFDVVSDTRRNVSPVLLSARPEAVSDSAGPTKFSEFPVVGVYTSYKTNGSLADPEIRFGLHLLGLEFKGTEFDIIRDDQLAPLREEKGFQLSKVVEFGHASRINLSSYPNYGMSLFLYGYDTVYDGDTRTTRGFANSHLLNTVSTPAGETLFGFGSNTPSKIYMGMSDGGALGDAGAYLFTTPEDGMFKRNFVDEHPNTFSGKFVAIDKDPFAELKIEYSGFVGRERVKLNFAPPGKPILAWQVSAADDGWVYKRKIILGALGKPKTKGGMIKLFEHGNTLQYMIVDRIRSSGASAPASKYNGILVWQKKVSDTKHELWARLFSVK